MKRRINITLLIGIIAFSLLLFWNIIKFVSALFSVTGEILRSYLARSLVYTSLPLVLALVFALLLFFKNLRMKKSKTLSIITISISALMLIVVLLNFSLPTIPQYLTYSKLGLVNSYFTFFLKYLISGGLLEMTGMLSCLAGGIISLIKQPKETL